jgi:choline dehydrogenase-like flavoprotein
MTTTQALIVGAGPTGMTAAIELRRAGLDVMIVDKSERLATRSQALVVQARTLEQFQRYGIAQKTLEHGRRLKGTRMVSEGKEIAHVTLDVIDSRYLHPLHSSKRNRGHPQRAYGVSGCANCPRSRACVAHSRSRPSGCRAPASGRADRTGVRKLGTRLRWSTFQGTRTRGYSIRRRWRWTLVLSRRSGSGGTRPTHRGAAAVSSSRRCRFFWVP